MANDKRPWAKIDSGYLLNPKWFQIERILRSDERIDERIDIRSVVRSARDAHLASILYCAQNMTDGIFPVEVVKALATIREEEELGITALFEVGLWINEKGGMARVHDYLEHQTSAAKMKQLSEAGKAGAEGRKANRTTNRTTNRNTEEKRREENYKPPINTPQPAKPKRAKYSPEFTEFWNVFPSERKADKPKCADKFNAAIKAGVKAQTIITAAQRYAADPNRESAFTVNPHRWLNEERWESGPLPPRAGSDPRANMTRSQRAAADAIQMHLANERPDLYGKQRQIGELS